MRGTQHELKRLFEPNAPLGNAVGGKLLLNEWSHLLLREVVEGALCGAKFAPRHEHVVPQGLGAVSWDAAGELEDYLLGNSWLHLSPLRDNNAAPASIAARANAAPAITASERNRLGCGAIIEESTYSISAVKEGAGSSCLLSAILLGLLDYLDADVARAPQLLREQIADRFQRHHRVWQDLATASCHTSAAKLVDCRCIR